LRKKVILLLIQIFAVAAALAMTVATYAWYTAQMSVEVAQTTVTAAAGAGTVIDSEEEFTYEPYMGQTGTGYDGDSAGGVDKPYTVSREVAVTFSPLGEDSVIAINLSSIAVHRAVTGETASSETNAEILNCFTWRAEIDGVLYEPDGTGLAVTYVDGTAKYYAVQGSKTMKIKLILVFLDEISYKNSLAGDYANVTPFAYSGYENMRATFECKFEVGLDVLKTNAGTEGV